jgi:probable rRNA maturation factor
VDEGTVVKKISVDVQMALSEGSSTEFPNNKLIQQWATAAAEAAPYDMDQGKYQDAQMTVRIVEEAEICQLNESFRHKAEVTNVLSFPFVPPPGIPANETLNSLGDLVVCAAVVNKEAKEQRKKNIAHWAHMIIHGTLHLMGFDHQNKNEACVMEALEIKIMSELGFTDPYAEI